MLAGDVRPTTLTGIKRLAKQIARENSIQHSAALDLAARSANFQNFRNAQRLTGLDGLNDQPLYVLLTAYWSDTTPRYRQGRETLLVQLSRPILSICTKSDLKFVRGFGGLRMVAPDHFVADGLCGSQSEAQMLLNKAERSLRFMEHTGLLPLRNQRKYLSITSCGNKLPCRDHPTYWIDPTSATPIMIDEPYGVYDEVGRAEWAVTNGWRIEKSTWPGMYNPYYCELHIAMQTRFGFDFDELVSKINAIPWPRHTEEWSGESSSSWQTFTSPLATTPRDARRARCKGTIFPTSSATTVPYSYRFGSRKRRPIGGMTVEEHIHVGRMIKAVLASKHWTYGIGSRLNSLRSTLEDWMFYEIEKDVLDEQEFFDVYYHQLEEDDPYRNAVSTSTGAIEILNRIKSRLKSTYPNCAPLRKQLNRIDGALIILAKM